MEHSVDFPMDASHLIAKSLALNYLVSAGDPGRFVASAVVTLGKHHRWLKPLSKRLEATFSLDSSPSLDRVVRFLLDDAALQRAIQSGTLALVKPDLVAEEMKPAPMARGWNIVPLTSIGMLADWLSLSVGELLWLAKPLRDAAPHYVYRLHAKRFGAPRLVEAPKKRLKAVQRQILVDILEQIPPHCAAHGFRKGHSIASFALPHIAKDVVLKLDLTNFFPAIPYSRIYSLFRTVGYPGAVASVLTGLCTHTAPRGVGRVIRAGREIILPEVEAIYGMPHLPQGAPTSPALANLCAFRLDSRLTGLARSAGAEYTRYADDLAFSGGRDFARSIARFRAHAASVIVSEGFQIHHRKTRIMHRGVRQYLAGIVVNERCNIVRKDFDTLKAILTNCVRQGARSQRSQQHPEFRRHLEGRVSFVEMVNPARGAKLRRLFEAIAWDAD